MFGGSVFLGQYFQVARGYAPTEAGLLTLPLVGGLMIASTVSGQLISRYGRWKGFLVAGAILTTTGLVAALDHGPHDVDPAPGRVPGRARPGGRPVHAEPGPGRAEHGGRHRGRRGQLAGGVPAVDGRHDRRDGAGDRAQPPGERAAGRARVGCVVGHLGPVAARRRRGRRGARRVRRRDRAGVPDRRDRLDPDAGRRGVHQGGPAADDGRARARARRGSGTARPDQRSGAASGRRRPATPRGAGRLRGSRRRRPAADPRRTVRRTALAALDDVERAARDLADARGRLASSVDRLRAAGFAQQQIDGLLARRVADGAQA